jgi:hypothetical protein
MEGSTLNQGGRKEGILIEDTVCTEKERDLPPSKVELSPTRNLDCDNVIVYGLIISREECF